MYFTDEERARYEEAHGNCHASRHSVSGSLTMHCSRCRPMPPLSPAKVEEIVRILGRHRPIPPHGLMRWRVRLYCGHVVEKRSHFKNTTLHSAFTGSFKDVARSPRP